MIDRRPARSQKRKRFRLQQQQKPASRCDVPSLRSLPRGTSQGERPLSNPRRGSPAALIIHSRGRCGVGAEERLRRGGLGREGSQSEGDDARQQGRQRHCRCGQGRPRAWRRLEPPEARRNLESRICGGGRARGRRPRAPAVLREATQAGRARARRRYRILDQGRRRRSSRDEAGQRQSPRRAGALRQSGGGGPAPCSPARPAAAAAAAAAAAE